MTLEEINKLDKRTKAYKEARKKLSKGDYLDAMKPVRLDYSKAKLEKVT
jgi:hypothetical protein